MGLNEQSVGHKRVVSFVEESKVSSQKFLDLKDPVQFCLPLRQTGSSNNLIQRIWY